MSCAVMVLLSKSAGQQTSVAHFLVIRKVSVKLSLM